MEAPDKIFIQPNAHDGWFEGKKPNDNFVEYIRKDALLEWIDLGLATRPITRSSAIAAATKTLLFVRKHISEKL